MHLGFEKDSAFDMKLSTYSLLSILLLWSGAACFSVLSPYGTNAYLVALEIQTLVIAHAKATNTAEAYIIGLERDKSMSVSENQPLSTVARAYLMSLDEGANGGSKNHDKLEIRDLLQRVKQTGTIGVVSYALWELGFGRSLCLPSCLNTNM